MIWYQFPSPYQNSALPHNVSFYSAAPQHISGRSS